MTDLSPHESTDASIHYDPHAAFIRRFKDPVRAYAAARDHWSALVKCRASYRRALVSAFWPYATLAILGIAIHYEDSSSDKAAMIGMCFLLITYTFFHTLAHLYWALKQVRRTGRELKAAKTRFLSRYGIELYQNPPISEVTAWARHRGLM